MLSALPKDFLPDLNPVHQDLNPVHQHEIHVTARVDTEGV